MGRKLGGIKNGEKNGDEKKKFSIKNELRNLKTPQAILLLKT
jgi:hypothetical protein